MAPTLARFPVLGKPRPAPAGARPRSKIAWPTSLARTPLTTLVIGGQRFFKVRPSRSRPPILFSASHPFYLPYEFTSVLIMTGNVNPFGIDPEQTAAILVGNVNPFDIDPEFTVPIPAGNVNPFGIDPEQTVPIEAGNVNPFGIDPEQTTPLPAGNTDPFGIDPEQTTVIKKGLTSSD